jgi:putative hydrolase of the HAD superfamily
MAASASAPALLPAKAAALRRGFDHVDTWVFDLDNTLYPASCNLFAQVDSRMSEYIAKTLGVPREHARHLQKSYFYQFGTTLAGLMRVHKLPPGPFLEYVHDIDLSVVPELPELVAAIEALPGRRLIFTNGSRRHAENVARRIGVLHLFEDICDIAAIDYVPKPERAAFDCLVRSHGVAPAQAVMFEDMPNNLKVASDLGMTTVLVHSDYIDHPAQLKIREWRELPQHIHYLTCDLTGFISNDILRTLR